MIFEDVSIPRGDLRKLLSAANPDATLLYIYLRSENPLEPAGEELNMSQARVSCAAAVLRQLGLWTDEKQQKILAGERPNYSERDVLEAMDRDRSFRRQPDEVAAPLYDRPDEL